MNLNTENMGFCFFAIFGRGAHFKSELHWNGWRQIKSTCKQDYRNC